MSIAPSGPPVSADTVARAGIWNLSATAIVLVWSFFQFPFLARLLEPSDFGLIAMAAPAMAFASLFAGGAFDMAILRQATIEAHKLNQLFYLGLLSAVVVVLLASAGAPLFARFMEDERLTEVVIALACGILISAVASKHEMLLRREYRNKKLFFATVIVTLVSGFTAIFMAWAGYGYWAIIVSALIGRVLRVALLFYMCKWRPGRPNLQIGDRSIWKFASNLTGFNIVNFFLRNADNLILGKVHGATEVGFYSVGYRFVLLPIQQFSTPLSGVFIPALSQSQSETGRPELIYFTYVKWASLVMVIPASVIFFYASEIMHVFAGEKWQATVPVIQVFCPLIMLHVSYTTIGWLYISWGRTDRMFIWSLIALPLQITAFIVGAQWGSLGMAKGFLIVNLVLYVPGYLFAFHGTGFVMKDLGKALMPSLLAGALSVSCIGFLRMSGAISDPVIEIFIALLVVVSLVSALAYLFCASREKELMFRLTKSLLGRSGR